jgi:hypothetical protein
LEKEAGDVGEKSAIVSGDAFFGDESEEFGHDAAEFFASSESWGAGEKFVGDGLEFGVIDFFDVALVDEAEFIDGTHMGICAAPAVS